MENVREVLRKFAKDVDLNIRFDYPLSTDMAFFSDTDKSELKALPNNFRRHLRLKELISKKYNSQNLSFKEVSDIDFWIINTWGGISSFKRTDRNIEKIAKFRMEVENSRLTRPSFETISSLSKISAFTDPSRYFVYDARVIYTLNWLILYYENRTSSKETYFPMPAGRNKNIVEFDLNTIINLHHKLTLGSAPGYYSGQEAYFKYCDFILGNYDVVKRIGTQPVMLEMLLFVLADDEIYNQLMDKTRILFN